jgi:hypothetical protein
MSGAGCVAFSRVDRGCPFLGRTRQNQTARKVQTVAHERTKLWTETALVLGDVRSVGVCWAILKQRREGFVADDKAATGIDYRSSSPSSTRTKTSSTATQRSEIRYKGAPHAGPEVRSCGWRRCGRRRNRRLVAIKKNTVHADFEGQAERQIRSASAGIRSRRQLRRTTRRSPSSWLVPPLAAGRRLPRAPDQR